MSLPATASIESLSEEDLNKLLLQLEEIKFSRLALYEPYQKQKDFHAAGNSFRERLFRAGNQNGKTYCGACEAAYHLTGQYPSWWIGKRFNEPVTVWASSLTGGVTRDNNQRTLMGPLGEPGTGTIPKDCIVDSAPARGIADLLDYVKVRHSSGGLSTCQFKFYEQGRQRWQGPPVHVVWFDEEPPEDIYDEGLARTIATEGIAYLTFTPLQGMSRVVMRFLTEKSPDRHDTHMTIDDALHVTPEQKAIAIASFRPDERASRERGEPGRGQGVVFPVDDATILIDPIKIPDHWALIGGLDFGWNHPTAAVKLAWDRDLDVIYVIAEYRVSEATPAVHSLTLKEWGKNLPWAWPHDGLQHSKDSGEQLCVQYRHHGLALLTDHAQFEDQSIGVEAGLMDMLARMESGRWKVFSTCVKWMEEFRLYHREDGKVVKLYDDLLSASRYGLMMKRRARTMTGKPQVTIEGAGQYNIHTGSYQGRVA